MPLPRQQPSTARAAWQSSCCGLIPPVSCSGLSAVSRVLAEQFQAKKNSLVISMYLSAGRCWAISPCALPPSCARAKFSKVAGM